MNPLNFQDFKCSVRGQLKLRKISFEQVDYIVLSQTHWMSFHDFMNLENVPDIWIGQETQDDEDDLWYHIDTEFRVVLKDGQWLQYIYAWSDPFYSHFRLITPPTRPTIIYEGFKLKTI